MYCRCYTSQENSIWTEKETREDASRRNGSIKQHVKSLKQIKEKKKKHNKNT